MDTVVIGIDGGEWNVLEPLLAEGALPNLNNLIETGVSGPLRSITPPVSPPAWNSIQTGTNPGKHGIFDFSTYESDYRRRSVNSTGRNTVPFWTVMNDDGISTGLFKVPFTYPPDDVDGFMVTGFPTPNSVDDYTSPSELEAEVGSPKRLFENGSYQSDGEYEKYRRNLVDVADYQTEKLLELLETRDPNLLMTVYDGADRVQHFFWKYFDEDHPRYEPDSPLSSAIREYYRTVDDGIGRILDRAGEQTNVLVISDHGFGPLTYDVYVDEWLEREGYLSRERRDSTKRRTTNVAARTLQATWDVVRRAGLASVTKSIVPGGLFERGKSLQDTTKQPIIWEETDAFFTTLSGQAIYVNREDRFRDGTVSADEYEAVVSELQTALADLRHPDTGEKLIENVHRSTELFEGEMVEQAPDLIVETSPEYTLKDGYSDRLVRPSKQHRNDRSGDHRHQGILIADGPDFGSGTVEDSSILDVAPTLLYLHDCPIPEITDGRVLQEVFTSDANGRREVRTTPEYEKAAARSREWSDEEEAEIDERLSDLGYLG